MELHPHDQKEDFEIDNCLSQKKTGIMTSNSYFHKIYP